MPGILVHVSSDGLDERSDGESVGSFDGKVIDMDTDGSGTALTIERVDGAQGSYMLGDHISRLSPPGRSLSGFNYHDGSPLLPPSPPTPELLQSLSGERLLNYYEQSSVYGQLSEEQARYIVRHRCSNQGCPYTSTNTFELYCHHSACRGDWLQSYLNANESRRHLGGVTFLQPVCVGLLSE